MGITVSQFVSDTETSLGLEILVGEQRLGNSLPDTQPVCPALWLGGVKDWQQHESLLVLGETEIQYLFHLDPESRKERFLSLLQGSCPCILIPAALPLPEDLLPLAEQSGAIVLGSKVDTISLLQEVARYIRSMCQETLVLQAVLMDVAGLGTLILGEPGVGKSEAALELIARGHRFVADDVVKVRRAEDHRILGVSPPLIEYHMEVRGLGIIDIRRLFGVRSTRSEVIIGLVVHLLPWEKLEALDRTGLEEYDHEILGVAIPCRRIPVAPGRNLAVVIEVACMTERLKEMGIHAARELDDRIRATMTQGAMFESEGI